MSIARASQALSMQQAHETNIAGRKLTKTTAGFDKILKE
jgi:hypothetical protein